MNKSKSRTGTRLFLIEFLIVLFFFLIISTVCLRIFARSHLITQDANALSHAQAIASSMTEVLEDPDTSLLDLQEFYPESELADDTLTLFFDNKFAICKEAAAFYTLEAKLVPQSAQSFDFCVSVHDRKDKELYVFSVFLYRPLTRGEVLK